MRTVKIEEFFRHIAPQAENCPDFVMRTEVGNTINDICHETHCLTYRSFFWTQPGRQEYVVPMPEGLDILQIRHMYCNGHRVMPARMDEVAKGARGLDWELFRGHPRFYTRQNEDEIVLIPVPHRPEIIRVEVVASVRRENGIVPAVFYNEYLDAVVYGALSRIFRIAGQTYTNIRQADEYDMRYHGKLHDIKIDTTRDFTRTTGTVGYNRIV